VAHASFLSIFDITTESWLHRKFKDEVLTGFKVLDEDEYWAGLILKRQPDSIIFVRASDGKIGSNTTETSEEGKSSS